MFGASSETFGSFLLIFRFLGIFGYEHRASTTPEENLMPLHQKKLAGVQQHTPNLF